MIVFAIVDDENDLSWSWFMTNLRALVGIISKLVIKFDHHLFIAKPISLNFSEAFHALCINHI